MPIYDRRCPSCERVTLDHYEPVAAPRVVCDCGADTERVWLAGASAAVHGDEQFIGGRVYENLGHEPVVVHSRSELRRELSARGLQEFVRHAPEAGTDKSRHTTNWATGPTRDQMASVAEMLARVERKPARADEESIDMTGITLHVGPHGQVAQ